MTPDKEIIVDNFPGRTLSPEAVLKAKESLCLRPFKRPAVLSLLDAFCFNYFHWFLDILPRVRDLEQWESQHGQTADLLIPVGLRPWHLASLEILREGRQLIEYRPIHGRYRLMADRLIIPSQPRFNASPEAPFGACDPGLFTWLNQKFRRLAVAGPEKRIFISRAKSGSRRIVNEDQCLDALAPLGYERYFLEDLPFSEQTQLFASARSIIAPHGAGLTNLVFANQANVIELHARGHDVRSDFYQICAALGLGYRPMVLESINKQHDMEVDPDQLIALHQELERTP